MWKVCRIQIQILLRCAARCDHAAGLFRWKNAGKGAAVVLCAVGQNVKPARHARKLGVQADLILVVHGVAALQIDAVDRNEDLVKVKAAQDMACLLYTSDAADEL